MINLAIIYQYCVTTSTFWPAFLLLLKKIIKCRFEKYSFLWNLPYILLLFVLFKKNLCCFLLFLQHHGQQPPRSSLQTKKGEKLDGWQMIWSYKTAIWQKQTLLWFNEQIVHRSASSYRNLKQMLLSPTGILLYAAYKSVCPS